MLELLTAIPVRDYPRLTRPLEFYCPHTPSDQQRKFLDLCVREAFYGGAAGGGKSDALLMAALQYVHVPGYAALILRKDTQRLKLAGGLIPRSAAWLGRPATRDSVRYHSGKQQWSFRTLAEPATLTFGYLMDATDRWRYGSSEFQYIAFDELTEFSEEDYLFLFSRLRRTRRVNVPLRMRSASNPGGIGHAWVKRRFLGPLADTTCVHANPDSTGSNRGNLAELDAKFVSACASDSGTGSEPELESELATNSVEPNRSNPNLVEPNRSNPNLAAGGAIVWQADRAFVPARLTDNPALDRAAYAESLRHLNPVLRQQLLLGDWSIHEAGMIQRRWLRYYLQQQDRDATTIQLLDANGEVRGEYASAAAVRFVTIDPAGTSASRAAARGGGGSYSVAQVWELPPRPYDTLLVLRMCWRRQAAFDELIRGIKQVCQQWRCTRLWIEGEKLGQAVVDILGKQLPIATVSPHGHDKVARAARLLTKLERGEIYLPQGNVTWLPALETEWLTWRGLPADASDQIDAAAYAANLAERLGSGGTIQVDPSQW